MLCAVSVIGTVYGLDAISGKELWRHSLGNFWDRWVYNSPVISEGKVYCGVAPYFAALDLKSGKEIWRSASLGGDWLSSRTSPVADDKKVYVGFNWSTGLFALDKQTGAVIWNKKEGFGITHCSPVLDNNIVYYAADNKLYALEKDTGKELWSSKLEGDWTVASPAVKDSVLVIGSPDGKVMAFDKRTGNKLWSFQTGPSIGSFSAYARGGSQIMATPLISGDTCYIGSNDGNLYALNLKAGDNLWKYNLGVPILSTPVVDNGLLYVTTYDGNVYVFKKKRSGAF
jgi:outer membrane protein assembly factor BamB